MSSGWSELFRGKSSIYALDEVSKEWVDRGISGMLIMFQNDQFRSDIRIKWSKNQRDIWWRLMNGKLKPKGERAWVLKAWDTSNNKQEILAIRFSDVQLSQQFSLKFHQIFPPQAASQNQPRIIGGPPPVPQHLQQQQQYQQNQQYGGYQQNFNQQGQYGMNAQNMYNNQYGMNGMNMMNAMGLNGLSINTGYDMHGQNGGHNGYPYNQQMNGGGAQNGDTWECAVCTYSNDRTRDSCIMCGLSRESTQQANSKRNNMNKQQQQQQQQQQMMANNGVPSSPVHNMGHHPNYSGGQANSQHFNFPEQVLQNMQQQSSQQRIISQFESHQMAASAVTSPHGKRTSWICPMCTLHNSINVTRCDACNASRNMKKGGNNVPNQPQPPQQQQQGLPMAGGYQNPLMMGMGMNGLNGMGMPNNNGMGLVNMGGMGMNGMNNGGMAVMMGGNGMGGPANMGLMNQNQMKMMSEMKMNKQKGPKQAATLQQFQNSASDIACYNDNPSQVFSTLRSVAKKLLKDDVRYRTLDTTNPKVMERLIGFEGVLDFLMLLGFESDAMGMKLICEQKPSQQVVRNAIEVLNTYESRLGLGRHKKSKKNKSKNKKDDDEQSYVTLGGPDDFGGTDGMNADKDNEEDTLTLEQIIIWSTHENMRDNDTMETLILTHKQFSNSITLIKNLRRRFDVPIPNDIRNDEQKVNEFRLNVQKPIQLKVIKSLRDWMKQYWDDDFLNDLEVQKELNLWLQELQKLGIERKAECSWIKPLAAMVQNEYTKYKKHSPNQAAKLKLEEVYKLNPDTGVPKWLENVPIKKGYKLSNTTAEDLADQITLMDMKIFSNIQERECIGQAWKKKKEQSPNVLAMIQQFNNLTVFVQLQILLERSLKDRGKAIKRVIKMGERFKELKNFNALCAILGALNSSPIHRLKCAWERVPEKQLNLFESFKQIFVNTRNFRNFRTLFRNVSPPAIPYFGLFLQDLVFIDDGNDQFKQIDNFKQHGFMINFNKCVRTMDRIKNIRLYQTNSSYNNVCKAQDFLQKILYQEFHKMKGYTENAIWEMSTQVKEADQKAAGIKKK